MTDINLNKDQLRVRMRTVRKALSDAERLQIDSAICKRVCDTLQFQEAEQVLTYVSMGFEVDTRHLIQCAWDAGKAVFAPRCVGLRTMRWFQIESFTGLQKSSFGVEEPLEDSSVEYIPSSDENALALVPGLALTCRDIALVMVEVSTIRSLRSLAACLLVFAEVSSLLKIFVRKGLLARMICQLTM